MWPASTQHTGVKGTDGSHRFSFIPGMSVNQRLPAQRYSSGGPAFGAPDTRYDLQTQPPFHDGYLVDTHGSYNFGNLPKPSSTFSNYLDGQLPRTIEGRTLSASITSRPVIHPGSSSSATLSPISPPLGQPAHEGFSSPLGTYSRHEIVANSNIDELTPPPHEQYLPMSSRHLATPSTSYANYPSSMDMDGASTSSRGVTEALPFQDTKRSTELFDSRQRAVHPEIHAKIDKGFFLAEGDWTCYRRNYFAVACSYKFKSDSGGDAPGPLYLRSKPGHPVEKFAMNIAACIDNDETKPIELVQHTPKRDKGPQTTPEKKILNVNPTGQLGTVVSSAVGAYTPSSPFSTHHQDSGYYPSSSINSPPPPPPTDEHQSTTYERIQFKKATANNGKRRAAQQYFYILVELHAGFRKSSAGNKTSNCVHDYEWHKVAVRMSAQMVVRGRSPGHYSDPGTRIDSNMGPGTGGNGSAGYYGMGPSGHGGMQNPSYLASVHRMDTYGIAGSRYTNRGTMQSEGPEQAPSLSSCSTLDDSSAGGDGSATISIQPSYVYGTSHVQGLMSPPFSLPPSSTSLGPPRSQVMPVNSFYDKMPTSQQMDYKPDPRWQQRRSDYNHMYNSQRYSGNMNAAPLI